jgi:hypothetical protein
MENIFVVDKDKDNITSSVQICCKKKKRLFYKFLIFDLEFIIGELKIDYPWMF